MDHFLKIMDHFTEIMDHFSKIMDHFSCGIFPGTEKIFQWLQEALIQYTVYTPSRPPPPFTPSNLPHHTGLDQTDSIITVVVSGDSSKANMPSSFYSQAKVSRQNCLTAAFFTLGKTVFYIKQNCLTAAFFTSGKTALMLPIYCRQNCLTAAFFTSGKTPLLLSFYYRQNCLAAAFFTSGKTAVLHRAKLP